MKDSKETPSPEELRTKIFEMLGRPIIAKIEAGGLTDDFLIGKAKEEFEATDKDGLPAWKVRQDARKDIHSLKGHYPSVSSATFIQQNFQQNNFVLSPVVQQLLTEDSKRMLEYVDVEIGDDNKGV